MLQIGTFSLELCGGTHARATGDMGLFKITSEGSVTSGVRRIEAITGLESMHYVHKVKSYVENIAGEMKCAEGDILSKIANLKDANKKLVEQMESLQMRLVNAAIDDILNNAQTLPNGMRAITYQYDVGNIAELERMADRLKEIPQTIAILYAQLEGKIQIICSIHPQSVQKEFPFHAGQLIKKICESCGGKGGGRPDFAKGSCPESTEFYNFVKNVFK
jgi:alanyl-tRNA synthetase